MATAINGRLIRQSNKDPLIGVEVQAINVATGVSGGSDLTDDFGFFEITSLTDATYFAKPLIPGSDWIIQPDTNKIIGGTLAFGTPPPTSATTGTGIWIDNTGIYGLEADVQQFYLDADDGRGYFGGGNAVIDEDGLRISGTFPTVILGAAASSFGNDSVLEVITTNSSGVRESFFLERSATAAGPQINFYKSRSTTIGAFTAANNGDTLGILSFSGDNGTAFNTTGGAYIRAYATENWTNVATGSRLELAVNLEGANTFFPVMDLRATGITTEVDFTPLKLDGVVYASQYASLQAAHDALPATGGTIVLGSDDTYTLTSRLNITKDNVTIRGNGVDNSLIVRNFAGANQLIAVTGERFQLHDVTIDANGNQGTGSVLLLNDIRAVLNNVQFRNYPYIGLDIEADCEGLRVTNCSFIGMNGAEAVGNYGVWSVMAFDKVDVSFDRCRFFNNQIGAIFMNRMVGCRITNCYFENNNFAGGGNVAVEGVGTGLALLIENNVFDCSANAGVSAVEANGNGAGYTVITGNAVYHGGTNGWGIVLQGGSNYIVANNMLTEPGAAGIMAYKGSDTNVRNFIIANNRIIDGTAQGIHIQADAQDYIVTGNDATGCASFILDSSLHAGRAVYGNIPVGLDDGILRLQTLTIETAAIPDATAGADLGSTANQWFNLFLSEGGKIDWDNGDATLTQVGNMLTLAGADLTVPNLTVSTAATVGGTAVSVSGHSHTDHVNRTRTVYRGCGDLSTITDGTPSLLTQGTNNRYRAWAMDQTTQEGVIGEFYMPEDYVSGAVTFKIHWTNLGAGAGDVQWQVAVKNVADAANLNTTGFTTASDVITAPAQDVLKISTSTVSFTPVAGSHIALRVRREAASVSDTLGNDAGLVAIEIEYTADM